MINCIIRKPSLHSLCDLYYTTTEENQIVTLPHSYRTENGLVMSDSGDITLHTTTDTNITVPDIGEHWTTVYSDGQYTPRLDGSITQEKLNLTKVTLYDTITTVVKNFCYNQTDLCCVSLPPSLTTIERGAFQGTGISDIFIPANVSTIEESAFTSCQNLTSESISISEENPSFVTGEYGELIDVTNSLLIAYPAGSDSTEYTIPNTVSTIGYYAFDSSALKHLNLKNSQLSTNSGLTVYTQTFGYCNELETIEIGTGSIYTLISGALCHVNPANDTAQLLCLPPKSGATTLNLPDDFYTWYLSANSIGENNTLEHVRLGSSSKLLFDGNIFMHCPNFKDIITRQIRGRYYLVSYGRGLTNTEYTVSANIRTISSNAFYGTQLQTIYVPRGCTITNGAIPDYVTIIRY